MTARALAAALALQCGASTTTIIRDSKGRAQLDEEQEYVTRNTTEEELAVSVPMVVFTAGDGNRSIRSLTYEEIAEAFLALGYSLALDTSTKHNIV